MKASNDACLCNAAPEEPAKPATSIVFHKMPLYMMLDLKLYQGHFAYALKICDCVYLKNFNLPCLGTAINMNPYMSVFIYRRPLPGMIRRRLLSTMIALPFTPLMVTDQSSARTSALTSATGCA